MINKRYLVSGMFSLAVEGRDNLEAKETAERILRCSGINGSVVEISEVRMDEQGDTQNHYSGSSGTKRAATAGGARQEGLCLHATKNEGIREAGGVGGEVRRMQATQWTPCGGVASVYSRAQR